MIVKICTKCKAEKDIEMFGYSVKSKDKRFYQCKSCVSENNRKYRKKHREKLNKCNRKYYKSYYKENRTEIQKKHKELYLKRKENWKRTRKMYYENNKERLLEIQKERLKNPIIRQQRNKVSNKRDKERRNSDSNYRIKKTLRCRIWHALKGKYKSKKIEELLGCTINEVKCHLEKKFKKGMSWSNYGSWHIDHIEPCDSFNLSNPKQQQICFHYTNLQPLWKLENLKKNNKIIYTTLPTESIPL